MGLISFDRLLPASLYSQSSILGHLAPLHRILLALKRIFFRLKAKNFSGFNPGELPLFTAKCSRGRQDSINFAEFSTVFRGGSWPPPAAGPASPRNSLGHRQQPPGYGNREPDKKGGRLAPSPSRSRREFGVSDGT